MTHYRPYGGGRSVFYIRLFSTIFIFTLGTPSWACGQVGSTPAAWRPAGLPLSLDPTGDRGSGTLTYSIPQASPRPGPTHWKEGGIVGGVVLGVLTAILVDALCDSGDSNEHCTRTTLGGAVLGGGVGFT